jgi:peptide chain release factor 2
MDSTKDKKEIEDRIKEIEDSMQENDFWSDKNQAQSMIKELQELKDAKIGLGKYDKGNAILTIFAGVGGDDAEDFARMLFEMYFKFSEKKGWKVYELYRNENSNGGFRSITVEILGKNAYGTLKSESGVHRLVRQSPFNAKGLRQTSFSMVEVVPVFERAEDFVIPETELEIEFTKSSGPGGQNVNKRETAVRITHKPTKLSVLCESERSQNSNREKALEILRGKLYNVIEAEQTKSESGMYISKTTDAAWGNQIRSYVLHPYKLVKDHRTNVETSNVESVLGGDIEIFIDSYKQQS